MKTGELCGLEHGGQVTHFDRDARPELHRARRRRLPLHLHRTRPGASRRRSAIDVRLAADAGGVPGAVIETIAVTVPDGATLVTATWAATPLLTAGTTYWIEAVAVADFLGGWHFASPAVNDGYAGELRRGHELDLLRRPTEPGIRVMPSPRPSPSHRRSPWPGWPPMAGLGLA